MKQVPQMGKDFLWSCDADLFPLKKKLRTLYIIPLGGVKSERPQLLLNYSEVVKI